MIKQTAYRYTKVMSKSEEQHNSKSYEITYGDIIPISITAHNGRKIIS